MRVLRAIENSTINMTKLQSSPIPSEPWHYMFHIDMEFDSMEEYDRVLAGMENIDSAPAVACLLVCIKGEFLKHTPDPGTGVAGQYAWIRMRAATISVNKEIRKRIKVPIMEKQTDTDSVSPKRLSGVGEYYFSKKLR